MEEGSTKEPPKLNPNTVWGKNGFLTEDAFRKHLIEKGFGFIARMEILTGVHEYSPSNDTVQQSSLPAVAPTSEPLTDTPPSVANTDGSRPQASNLLERRQKVEKIKKSSGGSFRRSHSGLGGLPRIIKKEQYRFDPSKFLIEEPKIEKKLSPPSPPPPPPPVPFTTPGLESHKNNPDNSASSK